MFAGCRMSGYGYRACCASAQGMLVIRRVPNRTGPHIPGNGPEPARVPLGHDNLRSSRIHSHQLWSHIHGVRIFAIPRHLPDDGWARTQALLVIVESSSRGFPQDDSRGSISVPCDVILYIILSRLGGVKDFLCTPKFMYTNKCMPL